MPLYRKKPVVIEARGPITEEETVETLEGTLHASVGDYIITGVQGEIYPVKPDIFEATYEPVVERPSLEEELATTFHAAADDPLQGTRQD